MAHPEWRLLLCLTAVLFLVRPWPHIEHTQLCLSRLMCLLLDILSKATGKVLHCVALYNYIFP